jgi:hypothetical protein
MSCEDREQGYAGGKGWAGSKGGAKTTDFYLSVEKNYGYYI